MTNMRYALRIANLRIANWLAIRSISTDSGLSTPIMIHFLYNNSGYNAPQPNPPDIDMLIDNAK